MASTSTATLEDTITEALEPEATENARRWRLQSRLVPAKSA